MMPRKREIADRALRAAARARSRGRGAGLRVSCSWRRSRGTRRRSAGRCRASSASSVKSGWVRVLGDRRVDAAVERARRALVGRQQEQQLESSDARASPWWWPGWADRGASGCWRSGTPAGTTGTTRPWTARGSSECSTGARARWRRRCSSRWPWYARGVTHRAEISSATWSGWLNGPKCVWCGSSTTSPRGSRSAICSAAERGLVRLDDTGDDQHRDVDLGQQVPHAVVLGRA